MTSEAHNESWDTYGLDQQPPATPKRTGRTRRPKLRIGIDPGLTGAIAMIHPDGTVYDAQPLPTLGTGAKKSIDVKALYNLVQKAAPSSSVNVERVQARPFTKDGKIVQMGARSAMHMGEANGAVLATIALAGLELHLFSPAQWKRKSGLTKLDKEAIRQMAIEQHPEAYDALKRKQDHNTAEAIFLAKCNVAV